MLLQKTTSDHVQPMSYRDFISFPSNSTIFVPKTSGHKQAGLVGQTSKGGHPVGISPHPESCQTVSVWMGLKKVPKNIRCPKHRLCVVARNGFASGGDHCKNGNPACPGQKAVAENEPPVIVQSGQAAPRGLELKLPLFFSG